MEPGVKVWLGLLLQQGSLQFARGLHQLVQLFAASVSGQFIALQVRQDIGAAEYPARSGPRIAMGGRLDRRCIGCWRRPARRAGRTPQRSCGALRRPIRRLATRNRRSGSIGRGGSGGSPAQPFVNAAWRRPAIDLKRRNCRVARCGRFSPVMLWRNCSGTSRSHTAIDACRRAR